MEAAKVGAGTRLRVYGQDWVVEGLRSGRYALRNLADATLRRIVPADLVRVQDYRVLDTPFDDAGEDLGPSEFSGTSFGFYEDLDAEVSETVLEKAARLNEIYTGSRLGDAELEHRRWKPRPEYDPKLPLGRRKKNAHAEYGRGWGPRQIERMRRAQRNGGIGALVNRATIRALGLGRTFEEETLELLLEVLAELEKPSNRDKAFIYGELEAKVKARNIALRRLGAEPLRLVGYRQFCRKFDMVGRWRGFPHLSAKTRRSIANEPKGGWRYLLARRPGQYVLIDVSNFDVLALDDRTGVILRARLVLAADLCTREVVAFRLIPREAKGVDAALILYDIVAGNVERVDADRMLMDPLLDGVRKIVRREPRRRAYVGVPRNVIVAGDEHMFVDSLRGLASVPAETVVVDRGKIFLSATFYDACRFFKISIQLCRPRRPTDKPQLERIFRRARRFLQTLPGYTGANVYERGLPEEEELLTISQLELALGRWFEKAYRNEPIRRLTLPGIKRNLSPREMFERLTDNYGVMRLPSNSRDFYRLLPTWWVKSIHGYGVELDGARYNTEAPFLRELRGTQSTLNVRAELRGRWPIRRDPRDITRAYIENPDSGELETLRMTHIPTDLAMSDAIWRIVKKHWKELGSDPRDVVGRQRAAAEIVDSLRTDKRYKRLVAQGGIDYEQYVRDTDAALEDADDAPAAVGHEPMFEIDSALLARASKAIKVTSLAEIRNLDNAEDHEIDEVEVA